MSAALLMNLAKGQALLAALRPLPASVTEELRHRYEVRLTYHSTAIEGNTLTQSETQIVIEKGITIAGKSLVEHLEVIGHKEALDFVRLLAEEDQPIGEREIREIHSLVMKGQGNGDIGGYRTLDVRAAGTDFVYPSHLKVPELMREFVDWLQGVRASGHLEDPAEGEPKVGTVSQSSGHLVYLATEAHRRFVTIHPFRDGNGRVGRLLMNLLLLRAGYPIAVLQVQRRTEYIDALVQAQQQDDLGPLLELVGDAVKNSLQDTLELCASSEDVRSQHPGIQKELAHWLDSLS
jgi:Fic family protein